MRIDSTARLRHGRRVRAAVAAMAVSAVLVVAGGGVVAAQPGTGEQSGSPTPTPESSEAPPPSPSTSPPPAPQAPSATTPPPASPSTPAPDPAPPSTPVPAPDSCVPDGSGDKVDPEQWTPTQNPKPTIVPGQMRSDCEELPEGFTKADADKAETMEAGLAARQRPGARVAAACQVYWPAPYQVCGAIRDKYNELGGPNGFLLWPTSNELTNPDGHGKRTTFQNGPIYWSAVGGAHPVLNHFMMKWGEHNWEAGWLGYPTSDEIVLTNGRRQEFQGGAIYWSPASLGTVSGAIRDRYNQLGAETGPLGYPNSDENSVTRYNGRYTDFLNGTITWSGQTGTRVLYGAVRDKWAQLGREDGRLGYPIADEQAVGHVHYADFENKSSIWWAPVTGAHEVPENVMAPWKSEGGQTGPLGLPVSDPKQREAHPLGVTLQQSFQHGVVNLVGEEQVYIRTRAPEPDNVPEPMDAERPGIGTRQVPDDATWPPADIEEDYDTGEVVGNATNANFPNYGEMVIRAGYWSGVWSDGWGQDKAEHKHNLRYPESVEAVLEADDYGPRSNPLDPGTDFRVKAMSKVCRLEWDLNRECVEVEHRIVHAIYDPTNWQDYKKAPGPFEPIGLVTAYCGGGNTPLAGTATCDSWVDTALMNPE